MTGKIIFLIFVDTILVNLGFRSSFLLRFPQSSLYEQFLKANFDSLPYLSLIYILGMWVSGVYHERFKSTSLLLGRTLYGLLRGLLFGVAFIYIFRVRWSLFPTSVFIFSFLIIVLLVCPVKIIIYKLAGGISRKVFFIEDAQLDNIDALSGVKGIDEIVIATKTVDKDSLLYLIKFCEVNKAKLSIMPQLYDEILVSRINGKDELLYMLPVYLQNNQEEWLIRISDIFIALILLFLSLPVMLLSVILIKIDSPGSIVYKQKRVGLNGKEFTLYKFRSMVSGAEQFSRPEWVSLADDTRVTKVGKFLRRTRIDELPQLFNVLQGDMSLVGPRPEAVYRVKQHRALQGMRLSVRPGLTGLAQIEGTYHTKPKHKIRYDLVYIHNRSVFLNLKLLVKTALIVCTREGS